MKWNTVIAFIIISLILPLTAVMFFIDESRSYIKMFLFFYSNIYFTTSVGSITSVVSGIYIRLLSISEFLTLKLNSKNTKHKFINVQEVDKTSDSKVIEILAEIYQDLVEICDEVNICYGFQTMLGFGLIFFSTLFTNFTAYIDIVNDGHLSSVTIYTMTFSVYFNFFLVSVILVCSLLEFEVCPQRNSRNLTKFFFFRLKSKNITKLLLGLMKETKDPLALSMLLSFSWLVKNRSPTMSCGFFDFNWNLVYTIAAAGSTNFIILMQFDLASRRIEV